MEQGNSPYYTETIRLGEQLRKKLFITNKSSDQLQIMNQQCDNEIEFEDFQVQPQNQQLSSIQIQEGVCKKINAESETDRNKHQQILMDFDNNPKIDTYRKELIEKRNSQSVRNKKNTQSKIKESRLSPTWQKYALTILHFIGRFIIIMKQYSQQVKFKQLSIEQFNLINDYSSNYDYYQKKQLLTYKKLQILDFLIKETSEFFRNHQLIKKNFALYKAYQTLKQIISSSIDPDSIFKYIWDLIILIFLISNIYYITLDLSFIRYFSSDENEYQGIMFNQLSIALLVLDICFNFKTAYYDKGILIKSKQLIFINYLTKRFFFDLIVFIFYILADSYNQPYLRIILLLRIGQINAILNNYAEVISLKDIYAAIYELSKLVLFVLFVGHFCACGFFILQRIEKEYGVNITWMEKFQIEQTSLDSYIASYYWACITMITVGYGDIVPTNTVERGFAVIMTLIACGVFAYTVNSIGTIISNLAQKNAQFKQKMSQLADFMKKRGMKIELQMKVKKYFQYLHNESNNDHQIQEMIMKNLTGELKNQVLIDVYGRILKSKKLFSLNFSETFLNSLSLKMSEKKFGPEDVIYKELDIVDSIYFILTGDVALSINIRNLKNEQQLIKNIQKGGIFGEVEFFTENVSPYSAISKNVVTAVVVSKQHFLECIKDFPIDYEKFCMMKDNYNLFKSSRGMAQKCSSCTSYSHKLQQCPFIQFIPFREQIIKKYDKQSKDQERKQMDRRDFRLQHTWLNIEIIKDTTIQYLINNYDQDDIIPLMQCIENINTSHMNNLKKELHSQSQDNIRIQYQEQLNQEQLNQSLNNQQQQIKEKMSSSLEIKSNNNNQNIPNNQQKDSQDQSQHNNSELSLPIKNAPSLENFNLLPTTQLRTTVKRKSFLRSSQKRLSLKQTLVIEELNKATQKQLGIIQPNIAEPKRDSELENKLQLQQIQEDHYSEEDSKSNQGYPINNQRPRAKEHSLMLLDEQYEQKQQQLSTYQQQSQLQIQQDSSKSIPIQDALNNSSYNLNNLNNDIFSVASQTIQRQSSFEAKKLNQVDPFKIIGGSKKSIQDDLQSLQADIYIESSRKSLDPSTYSKVSDKKNKSNQDSSQKNAKPIQNKQNLQQEEEKLFVKINNFDKMKDWNTYYTHNNPSLILNQITERQKLQIGNQSKQKKQLNELYSKFNQSKSQRKLELKRSTLKKLSDNEINIKY